MRPSFVPGSVRALLLGAALTLGLTPGARAQVDEATPPGDAPRFSAFNIQYLYGFNWDLGSRRRDFLTYEHAFEFGFGDQFLFVDVANLAENGADAPTFVYGEWQPRVSLSRLLRIDLSTGRLRDVFEANELNFGSGYLAHLHGLGTAFVIPGFEFAVLNAYLRNDLGEPGVSWQVSVAGSYRFRLGSAVGTYGGYVDIVGAEGESAFQAVSQTQLVFDIGAFFGSSDRLYAGAEFVLWANELGIRGQDEFVPQLMIKWVP